MSKGLSYKSKGPQVKTTSQKVPKSRHKGYNSTSQKVPSQKVYKNLMSEIKAWHVP